MAHYYCTNLWRRSRNHSLKPSIFTHSKPLKGFVLQHSVIKPKHFRSLVRGIVRGFEWVEILGFTVLIYIVQLNWRWLMMHERSMKKEPWPKSHKWRCFKHFHGFKNRLAWAKTVRIFTKGGTAAAQCSSSAGITNRTARLYRPWQAFHIGAKVLESLGSEFQIIALHCNPACTQPLCIYTQIWTSQQHIKKRLKPCPFSHPNHINDPFSIFFEPDLFFIFSPLKNVICTEGPHLTRILGLEKKCIMQNMC